MAKLREKIDTFEEKLKNLEEEFSLIPSISVEFPQYKVLPHSVELALKVLEEHKYKFMLAYKEKK